MAYTLCAFDDAILKIPMTRIYKTKTVDLCAYEDLVIYKSVHEVK